VKIALLSQPRDAILTGGPQKGSVAIVLDALARRLAPSADVAIVAPRATGQPLTEEIATSLRVYRVPDRWRQLQRGLELARGLARSSTPHIASPLYFPDYAARAARLLAREPPDIVHVMSFPQFAPALRRALPRAKLVLHLHDEIHMRLPAALAESRLRAFDAVVTCSAWLERSLKSRFPDLTRRIHHVGNGVDLDAFSPAPSRRAPERIGRLLFVGRISPERGVHLLVEALDGLRERYVDLSLDLVGAPGLLPYQLMQLIGHGPAAAALAFYGTGVLGQVRTQILAARHGYLDALEARLSASNRGALRLAGPLPHDRLADAYRAADVFVWPSLCEEPFGIPLVEAMACGLPVVATRSGGVADIVEHGVSGLLVERNDPAGLAEAIASLLDAPALRASMGSAGRARAEQLFGWEQAARRLAAVYGALAGAAWAEAARNSARSPLSPPF
jgi:glycosyltransferase involved in cell wall biosynthesis